MNIPERSPDISQVLKKRKISFDDDISKYAREYNERYLHWDELRYRDLGKVDVMDVWALMKVLRELSSEKLNVGTISMSFSITNDFQRKLHYIDSRILPGLLISDGVDDKRRIMLSVSSMMEESIASSQLEGASTTTKLAKKLLRSGSEPRDRSQQMILNNYRAMQLIRSRLNEQLTPELILDIHRTITAGTLDDSSFEGRFRSDNSVTICDRYEDVTYHDPVDFSSIGDCIAGLCEYINDSTVFTHPLVKGIMLHFAMGYIHPFMDGNGRVARSLFYWYSMKNGYSMIEYLSISKVIKKHRQKYDLAYLLTETDGNDVTYFIDYNLRMITESIEIFDAYLKRKANEQRETMHDLERYGLNYRQSQMFKDLMRTGDSVSVIEVSQKYQITTATARRDLQKLAASGLVRMAGTDGHRQMFTYNPDHE